MRIIQFGGYTLPAEQLEMSESGGLGRAGSTLNLPGAGGSWDIVGVGPDPLAEDSITKSFIISASTPAALQTAIDSFVGQMLLSQNDWRQGLRLLVAELPDGSRRGTWAKCIEARFTQEYFHFDNAWLGPVNVTWRRSWPVWGDYEDLLYFGDHLGTFQDTDNANYTFGQGVVIQAVNASPTEFTITNGGNARVMAGLIELDGVITNPTITNTRNKHTFTWDGVLAAGDRFTLNIAAFDAKKNGAPGEWLNITVGTERGQLLPMVLEPGANPMRVTGTSPNCTFRFYFAPAWA